MATPLERVQAAWATGDRMALHREVEQLAAEGHSQQVLEEALESLLLQVRAAGADDDTEEIINGVWDRLTGWCRESQQIKTLVKTNQALRTDANEELATAIISNYKSSLKKKDSLSDSTQAQGTSLRLEDLEVVRSLVNRLGADQVHRLVEELKNV